MSRSIRITSRQRKLTGSEISTVLQFLNSTPGFIGDVIDEVHDFSWKPNPDVEWLDTNGRPITAKSDRFKVTTVDRLTTLAILGVDNDTEGKYLLKVKNEIGEAKCEILVKAQECLNAPNRPILEKQKFNSVNLKWDAIPEAITKKVQYIVEMKEEKKEEWITATETIQPNATMKELELDNTYRFRVRAIIAGVTSEPSEESESFVVEYKKLEEKEEEEQIDEQKEKINDELFADVKSSEYCDIDVLQFPNDLESKVTVVESTPRMAPKFEVPLQDQTALAGKEVKLKCRILGDPQPQIIWMKDGTMINTTRHQRLEFTEDGWCSLIIFNCTAKDTGSYLCRASNVLGSESSQLMLTIAEIAGPDSHLITAENKEAQYCKPRFTRVPSAVVEASEGSLIKLISRAIGLPKPLIKWLKDGKEITKTNRSYEILLTGEGESVLNIPYVVTKTAGIFKCVAENSEGLASFETQLIVHNLHKQYQEKQAPIFTMDLTDVGVAIGNPVMLKCHAQGIPEPQLKWIFINDAQQISVIRTTIDSAWAEYRQGEICEMKTENVVKTQQGTYQCIAINEHGRAMTQCYLLVGEVTASEPFDRPAGPPRFLKCMRDIWAPLGDNVEFEVEVSGYPLPELTWYHMDEKVLEERNVLSPLISYITPTKCQLKITNLSVSHLGTYSVEASNIHGIVRTTASLNVGKKCVDEESPKLLEVSKENFTTALPQDLFSERLEPSIAQIHRAGTQYRGNNRLDIRRRGAVPAFLIGLEDLEFREGDAAALAGTIARKRRHRIHGKSERKHMKQAVTLNDVKTDTSTSSSSVEPQSEITTLEEIRASIAERNKNICRPKFMVKPKSKKSIVEYKSLRLRAAISANPIPVVRWDKAGVVLETGNKYSIYNDGDFYYLEVHHMSKIDEGFYNCSASNSEGLVTCTAEIEVLPGDGTRRLRKELTAPTFIEVLPGKFKVTNGDSVSIECSVSSYPASAIQWLRNGSIILPEHDRYLISYDGETTTLKFINITTSDAGKYVCIAKNQVGEAKTAMQLDVETRKISSTGGIPPKFRTDGRQEAIKAIDGDRVVLLAELMEGSEPLTVRWIRNKMEIQDSSGFGYSRKEANCCLTIADAFPEDAGVYTCEASNDFGVAKCNVRLIVTEKRQNGHENPPIIMNAPTNVSVERGNDLTLSVTVCGYPEPAVVWTKNMVSVASGEKYQMANSGEVFTLTIRNCISEDHGKYELQAVNLSGTAKAIIAVDVIEVTNLDAVRPRFTKLPISIQSTVGQKASLTCNFKGLQPIVTWFHGDEKLINGRHGIEISSAATTSTLSILQLAEEHLGEYLCTIRNDYGEDLAKAVIFLEGSSVALALLNSQ